jgi:hypothetical protein
MAAPLKVEIYKGSNLLREERFERDIIKIGRLASAHLKLDDPRVARIHAVIEATSDGQGFSIIDMGSTDGTYVNGERVSKERIGHGDEVTVGDCRLVIRIEDATEAVAAPMPTLSAPPPEAEVDDGGELPVPPPSASSLPGFGQAAAAPPPPPAVSLAPAAPVMAAPVAAAPLSVPPPATYSVPPPAAPVSSPSWAPPPASIPPGVAAGMAPMGSVPPGAYAAHSIPPGTLPPGMQYGAWGSAPNNLASQSVPETDRMLEIKIAWGDSVLEAFNVYDQKQITMGDEARTSGWGPFTRYIGCDIDVPAKSLPVRVYPIAEHMGSDGANYAINIHETFTGRLERADGSVVELSDLVKRGERSSLPGVWKVPLLAEDTLYLRHGEVLLQIRYVRRTRFVAPPWFYNANYTYLNIFILALFFHVLAIASFIAQPQIQEDLTESLFKNPNRFHQFEFIAKKEEKKKNDLLAKLKAGGPAGAKARGAEGKAGRKDMKQDTGKRMAVKGDPTDKEIAKSTLNRLFGNTQGGGHRSYLFGTGGLGGELKAAMGGVTGAEVGDSGGLGGLGTRGAGPGGGGLSMSSVGLGGLGTSGRGGGGDGGYGDGVGSLGKKADRSVDISAGSPIIMGSLDKEIIRRVIKNHIAQIRYCYEKELVRTPGLFGKVTMEFIIKGDGSVSDAKVKETTLKSAEVERCMGAKIRTWTFPKPKGGGIVIVKYPFVLKRSG